MIIKYYCKFEKEIYLILWQMTTLNVLHINWKGWKYIWYFRRGSNYCRNWNRMLIFSPPSCITGWRTSEKSLLYNETLSEVGHLYVLSNCLIKMILLLKKLSLLGLKHSDCTHQSQLVLERWPTMKILSHNLMSSQFFLYKVAVKNWDSDSLLFNYCQRHNLCFY